MTIKELASLLQKRIDIRMKDFNEQHDKIKEIAQEIEKIEKKMFDIIVELEPVESLIYNQNPSVERIFESIKRVYGKDSNGIDRAINQ
jgi:t-SNARE complex subunit (syntaxin)